MNNEHPPHRGSPEEYAALFDAAKRRATELRREAIRAFWARLAGAGRHAWQRVRHAAPRLPAQPLRNITPCPR